MISKIILSEQMDCIDIYFCNDKVIKCNIKDLEFLDIIQITKRGGKSVLEDNTYKDHADEIDRNFIIVFNAKDEKGELYKDLRIMMYNVANDIQV